MKENKRDNLSTGFKCMKIVIKMTWTSCSPSSFRTKKKKVSHSGESLVCNKMIFLKINVIDTESSELSVPGNT